MSDSRISGKVPSSQPSSGLRSLEDLGEANRKKLLLDLDSGRSPSARNPEDSADQEVEPQCLDPPKTLADQEEEPIGATTMKGSPGVSEPPDKEPGQTLYHAGEGTPRPAVRSQEDVLDRSAQEGTGYPISTEGHEAPGRLRGDRVGVVSGRNPGCPDLLPAGACEDDDDDDDEELQVTLIQAAPWRRAPGGEPVDSSYRGSRG
ncbi:uncharacterized protein [Lepisosteus oculatus]|uniref:uncharacterized protein n=1 Tax=Lepisosteus oculatus TaxID=7918 RepID=UPI0035F52AD0